MSKWITTVVASVFALTAASGFAQGFKKEELSAEQKSEIRDRVERLKAERAKAETAKPAEPAQPAKAATPKRTSKTMTRMAAPKVTNTAAPAKAPAVTTTAPKL
jgi:hypothetical protein